MAEKTLKTYELREGAGSHKLRGEDADGNLMDHPMQPGEQVRSYKPLNRMFPNKFDCVDDIMAKAAKKARRGPLTEPVRPAGKKVVRGKTEDEEGDEFKIPELYEPHIDHESDAEDEVDDNEKPYRKSDKKKLKAQKENREGVEAKHERRAAKKAGKINDDSKDEVQDDGTDGEGYEPDLESLGEDVTDEFDGAQEHDLKVFVKGKHYSVYDADDLSGNDPTPRTDKPLTKAKAAHFVKNYKG